MYKVKEKKKKGVSNPIDRKENLEKNREDDKDVSSD
jgi:hypothetical protein